MNLKWQNTLPTEAGMYWFYGELHMGSMGMHFREDYIHEPEMTLVNIHPNIISAEGAFVSSNNFNKQPCSGEGWLGYWAKADLPTPPYDGDNLFKTAE